MTKATSELCMGCMGALGGHRTCPHCGYIPGSGYDKNYIEPGTILANRYLVGKVTRQNGEGAQYIGYDNNIGQPVWIQEYFPRAIAERGEETRNILALPGYGAQYKALMSDFVDICNEVKRLSITELVVPIDNVFSENNTVYAVYRDMDLVPLETWLEQEGGKLELDDALSLFIPLFNTLSNIHGHGAIHRGISPYTVYIDQKERLYLWDFSLSATRTANSELEAELFSGYSAPEQYSSSGWQGSWTDVYAVAALFYRAVSGVVPPKSSLVGPGRPVAPLDDLVMGVPKNISDAIGAAMHPMTEQRTQSIATLSSQLTQRGGMTRTAVYDTNRVAHKRPGDARIASKRPPGYLEEEEPVKKKSGGGTGKYVALGLLLTVLLLGGCIVVFMTQFYPHLVGEPGGTSAGRNQQEEEEDGQDNTAPDVVPVFVGRHYQEILDNPQYEERFNFVISEDFDDVYEEGEVFDQSPEEGTPMPEKGTVVLFVSKGILKVEVPDLEGETFEDAVETLFRLDPDLQIEKFERRDSSVGPGCVISTTPPAGEEIDPRRQKIYLFITPQEDVLDSTSKPEESSKAESSQSSQPPPRDDGVWTPWYD